MLYNYIIYSTSSFIQDFFGGEGRSLLGTASSSVMHEYATHTRVSMNASLGVWGHMLPQEIFLDLRGNLGPGSDYF